MVANNYKQLSAWSETTTYDLKISKKGKIFLGKKKGDNAKLANMKLFGSIFDAICDNCT